jgi:hypothetical protein
MRGTEMLTSLEEQLRKIVGGWSQYRFMVWQKCRSFEAASVEDRLRIAQEVLADRHKGEWVWALGGQHMLLAEIVEKLDDSDPHIRAGAIVALSDLGAQAHHLGRLILDRILSPSSSLHERTLAAWALPKVGWRDDQASAKLLVLLDACPEPEAAELRVRIAEAIEHLDDSFRILVPLARRLLADEQPTCRLHGLRVSERLLQRDRRLWPVLRSSLEALGNDQETDVRTAVRRIVDEFQS